MRARTAARAGRGEISLVLLARCSPEAARWRRALAKLAAARRQDSSASLYLPWALWLPARLP